MVTVVGIDSTTVLGGDGIALEAVLVAPEMGTFSGATF